jgi:hypothetical protein
LSPFIEKTLQDLEFVVTLAHPKTARTSCEGITPCHLGVAKPRQRGSSLAGQLIFVSIGGGGWPLGERGKRGF